MGTHVGRIDLITRGAFMKRITKSSLAALALAGSVSTFGSIVSVPVASASSSTVTLGQYAAYTDQFIPMVASDLYTANITNYAFDALLTVDGKFQFNPDIVKSYSYSKDKKTITMIIDPRAKWSDGQPIVSQDVLLMMNYLASKVYNTTQQGQYGYIVQNVVGYDKISAGKATDFSKTGGFTVVSSKKFQIHLNSMDAAILNADLATIQPVPYHIMGKVPFAQWPTSSYDKQPTVVSGMYQFTNVQGTNNVEMTANSHYFRGVPKIQNVVWETVSTDVAPGLLASGKLDFMVEGFKPSDVAKLKQVPGITVDTEPANQYYYMGLRMENYPEFKDVRVRQAFQYGMDRQSMITGIMKGYAQTLNGPIPPVVWAAAPASVMNSYAYNPAKANQLLNAAGWKIGKDGLRIDPRTGKTANLLLQPPQDPGVRQPISEAIAQEFQKLHLKVTVQPPLDIQTFYKDLEDPKYKNIMMYVGGWTNAADPDPRGIWDTTDAFNMEHWADPKNDQLIKATWALPKDFTVTGREAALVKWQEYVNQQMPLNFLFANDNVFAFSNHLQIPASDITAAGLLNPQDWTLN